MKRLLIVVVFAASILLVGCKNAISQLNNPHGRTYIDTLTVYIQPNETVLSVSEIPAGRGYISGYTITIFNGDMYYTKFVSRWDLPITTDGNKLIIKYKKNIKW